MRRLIYTVPEQESGKTAESFLKSRGFSRRVITLIRNNGGLTRNGEILRMPDKVYGGDELKIVIDERGGALLPNPELEADIAYEDNDCVVFIKPAGMAVHPSVRHYDDTLGNLFAVRYPDRPFRPINRLDRNTSGLCVCAKNQFAAAIIAESISKVYFAAVSGDPPESGTIDAPIARESGSIIKRCVSPEGKPAVTRFETIRRGNGHSLLRIALETGRTHQIRVHFSHIGFPLCGDDMYGGDTAEISRQALHCGEVSFCLPEGGRMSLSCPLPEDIEGLFN